MSDEKWNGFQAGLLVGFAIGFWLVAGLVCFGLVSV